MLAQLTVSAQVCCMLYTFTLNFFEILFRLSEKWAQLGLLLHILLLGFLGTSIRYFNSIVFFHKLFVLEMS